MDKRVFFISLPLLLVVALAGGRAQDVQVFGDNTYQQRDVPAQLRGVVSVSGGLGHSTALMTDGTVKTWGTLLTGNAITDVIAVSSGSQHAAALKADGTVVAWGSNTLGQTDVPLGLTRVKAIDAAGNHTLALKDDGTVVGWGDNSGGQLDVIPGLSGVIAIAAGATFSVALKADGTVVSWGNVPASVPGGLTDVIAIDAGRAHVLALRADGSVVGWGSNGFGQRTVPSAVSGVIAIAAGSDHSLALKADGRVVAWGRNHLGQTAVPGSLANIVEIAAGENHTLVRKADNYRVRVWGSDRLGEPPFDLWNVKSATGGAALSAGTKQGLAITGDGTLAVWGSGAGATLPGSVAAVKEIVSGYDHVVALHANGTLTAWGDNSRGQTNIPPGLSGVKALAAGAYHTLALKSDGTVVGFGDNISGMVDIPPGLTDVIAIAAGPFHSLALKADGTVVAWGQASGGVLNIPAGLNTIKSIDGGLRTTVVLKSDGTIQYFGSNSHGQMLTPPNIFPLRSIVAGGIWHLALKSNGVPVAWGFSGNIPHLLDGIQTISRAMTSSTGGGMAIVSDHPPLITNVVSPVTYPEGATAQKFQSAMSLSDNGHANVTGATIAITQGFLAGDQLAVTTPAALTATYNNTSGLLTITGTETVGAYEAVLRSLTYHATSATPAANATRTITMRATDGVNWGIPVDFTINIAVVNDAPSFTKGNDITINEDAPAQTVNAWATSISKGPANESAQTVTFSLTNDNNSLFSVQPAIDAAGKLTFTPDANQNGTAIVTVVLRDNGGTDHGGIDQSAPQTFTITVAPVNDAPSFTLAGDVTVDEDALPQSMAAKATNLSAGGGVDEAGQALTFVTSNDNTTLFSVQPAFDAHGALNFTPAAQAVGTATVTVSLKDNGGTAHGGSDNSAAQTFQIIVAPANDAPSFTKGNDINVHEDAAAQTVTAWATAISTGPADESTQTVTFTLTNDTNTLFSVQPVMDASGELTFTPAANQNGTAIVTVVLRDNGGTNHGGVDQSAPQTFTITVSPVNDAPSFTLAGDVSVYEDAPPQTMAARATNLSAGGGADEAGQALTFITSNDNTSLFSVQPAFHANGELSFTPAAQTVGTATVTVSLKDDGGTADGGSDISGVQTFQIIIAPVNDAPSFTKGNDITINEDTPAQTVNAWATSISKGPANESAQTLTFSLTNDNNSLFSTQPAIDAAGELTFTPDADQNGTAIVTVVLRDNGGTNHGGVDQSGPQTFTITVAPVNDAPSFTLAGDVTVDEDAPPQSMAAKATNLSAGGGADEAGQALTFITSNDNTSLFSVQPALDANGALNFTPAAQAVGTATVTVSLKDNGGTAHGGSDNSAAQTFQIIVAPVNDAPSFTKGNDINVHEDAAAQTVTAWATAISTGPADESAQTYAFVVTNDNTGLFSTQPSVNASGALTFTPQAGKSGTAAVTLYMRDNGGTARGGDDSSDDQTFTITITPVNDAPSFTKGADITVGEDSGPLGTAAWATGISAGAPDESMQQLTFMATNDNNGLFAVQPSVSAAGDISFTPAPDAFGAATVTLLLHDDGGTAQGGADESAASTFTITVTPVNDAPLFTRGDDVVAVENSTAQSITAWATAISAGPGEATQTVTFVATHDNNTLFSAQPVVNSAGTLSFTPAPGRSGTATVTLVLHDDGGTAAGGVDQSAPQTFTITVNPINHAPSFSAGTDITVLEDAPPFSAPWATAISAGDDHQALSFVVSAQNTALFAVPPAVSAAGVLSFRLRADAFGTSVVSVYLKDDGGTLAGGIDQSAVQAFHITVDAVNDAPHIDPVNTITTAVNTEALEVALTGIHPGSGEDDQQLTIEAFSSDPSILPHPQVTGFQNGTATLLMTPAQHATGTVEITITVRDDGGTDRGGVNETSLSLLLNIEDVPQPVFLPTLFSPNGNSVNDVFRVRGAGIAQISFRVYDTSGREIFSTADVSQATETGWDGKYKGHDMPAGVYTWTLQGTFYDGKPLTTKASALGQVILLR